MQEISAGGVVIDGNNVLVLKKYRGDWVLPKGRLEASESREQAALREVREESGVNCEIVRYIGFVKYNYRHFNGERVQKTVHYYHMTEKKGRLRPQKEEGFCEAVFLPWRKAAALLRHESERNMVRNAFRAIQRDEKKDGRNDDRPGK